MPANLPNYDTWIKDTAVLARIRSSELKTLDTAIKTFGTMKTDANQVKVAAAFKAWTDKEGVGWRQSKRNAKGSMTGLEDLLSPRAKTTYTNDQAHSRKGLLFLFANTELDIGLIGFCKILLEGGASIVDASSSVNGSLVGNMASQITTKSTQITISGIEAAANYKSGGSLNGPWRGTWDKIVTTLRHYCSKIWEFIKSKANAFWQQSRWEKAVDIANYTAKIVQFIADRILTQAAPFISAGVDIVKGVYATSRACYERYKAYSLGKDVELNAGHPGAVADSIKRAMNLGIGKGLYDTMKGTASLTAQIFTGGAAAIAMLVVAGCELLAKVVYRIWETLGMRSFFKDCKELYAKGEEAYSNASDFQKWYRNAAYALPCLSALAINSGITGDAMMYLRCFADEDEKIAISQEKFNQGVSYLGHLKDWSRAYLADAGYEFDSKNVWIKTILAQSMSKDKPKLPDVALQRA